MVEDLKKDLLKKFKVFLETERNFSSHTVRAYIADVETFMLWLEDDILKLTNEKFTHFILNIGNVVNKTS